MKYWITKTGEKIPLSELTKERIHHIIDVLEKNLTTNQYCAEDARRAKLCIKTLERELERRKKKYSPLRLRLESLL